MRSDLQRLKRDAVSGVATGVHSAISSSAISVITQQYKTGLVVGSLIVFIALLAAGFGLYSLLIRSRSQPFKDFTVTQITNTGKAQSAALSPDGKYIVNVQNDNGTHSLYGCATVLTGSDTQIIPPEPVLYRSLAFSPDGNYVYFRRAINASADLYRVPVLGGTPQLIVRDVDSNITFSPDARRIAYTRGNDPKPGQCRLLSAGPDGSDEAVLAIEDVRNMDNNDCPRLGLVNRWQDHCSYLRPLPRTEIIKAFDLPGSRFRLLARFPNTLLYDIRSLPEGDRLMLAYSEKGPNSTHRQIGVVSRCGGKVQPVTRDANSYSDLTLSADGKTAALLYQVKTTLTLTSFRHRGSMRAPYPRPPPRWRM